MKIGYHTVLLSIPIDFFTEGALFNALQVCSNEMNAKHYKESWAHVSWTTFELFKDYGMLIYLKNYHLKSDNKSYVYKVVEIRLNPKRLTKKSLYVEVSQYKDYNVIATAFKKLLKLFGGYTSSFA